MEQAEMEANWHRHMHVRTPLPATHGRSEWTLSSAALNLKRLKYSSINAIYVICPAS